METPQKKLTELKGGIEKMENKITRNEDTAIENILNIGSGLWALISTAPVVVGGLLSGIHDGAVGHPEYFTKALQSFDGRFIASTYVASCGYLGARTNIDLQEGSALSGAVRFGSIAAAALLVSYGIGAAIGAISNKLF
jgi:hypothetical protein